LAQIKGDNYYPANAWPMDPHITIAVPMASKVQTVRISSSKFVIIFSSLR